MKFAFYGIVQSLLGLLYHITTHHIEHAMCEKVFSTWNCIKL